MPRPGDREMPSKKGTAPKAGNTLMVFFKCPEEGRAKTRLAREIGGKEALKVCRALLRYTFEVVEGFKGTDVVLFYDTSTAGGLPAMAIPKGWRTDRQAKGDLGQRFAAAFRSVLGRGAKKAVVIGADCVGLSVAILEEAFAGLDGSDVTLGPAEDGGYYILGLKDPAHAEALLSGISWGTDKVFEETVKKAGALGLQVHTHPRLFDVDTAKDWERARRTEPRMRDIFEAVENDGGWP